jgi:hypothetical protein
MVELVAALTSAVSSTSLRLALRIHQGCDFLLGKVLGIASFVMGFLLHADRRLFMG